MFVTVSKFSYIFQEYHLTRRLTFANSLRIRQNCKNRSLDDWHYETFLPLLFRREPISSDFSFEAGIDCMQFVLPCACSTDISVFSNHFLLQFQGIKQAG